MNRALITSVLSPISELPRGTLLKFLPSRKKKFRAEHSASSYDSNTWFWLVTAQDLSLRPPVVFKLQAWERSHFVKREGGVRGGVGGAE